MYRSLFFFFFQAEDGIRDLTVTGVQTCALPIFVGSPWQVRIHPSPTSSGVSALFTRILTEPSSRWAMHVAQLPCSHENGGLTPGGPAASRIFSPSSSRRTASRLSCRLSVGSVPAESEPAG